MKKTKKILCSVIAGLTLFSGMVFSPEISSCIKIKPVSVVMPVETKATSGRLYNQYDQKWKNTQFEGYTDNMYNSGCGIFSFCNAIYALNGKRVDAYEVARWAVSISAYRPGNGGMYRDIFYNNVQNAYGSKLGFRLDGRYYADIKDNRLISHLSRGGVAVIHVKSHFVVATEYSNGKYHVIESAVSNTRELPADSWVTADKLSSGNTNVDWFVLISDIYAPVVSQPVEEQSGYFKQYTGFSDSIITALKTIGEDSSYSHRQKIATTNGISNYSGTAYQNTTMLNMLKQGTLKKADVVSAITPVIAETAPSVEYFRQYTGFSDSIIVALSAIGEDSSYSYRQKIATANGITNYSGTAYQNISMLNLLKQGKLKKTGTVSANIQNTYYFRQYTGFSGSIAEALRTIGEESSFSYRQRIALKNSIINYSGTAYQNTVMLNLLKSGKLIKP